eukprot:939316_1
METFKKRAHNLYSIQREEEFMQQTAAQVLPLLLDADTQRKVMVKLADPKGLQRWMIFRNKTAQDVLPDFDTLKHVLDSGNMQCVKWMISFKEQVEKMLMDEDGANLSQVIQYGYLLPVKQVINLPRVLELCRCDWKAKIVEEMFKDCANVKVVDYVLDLLGVSPDDLIKLLSGTRMLLFDVERYNKNSLSILKVIVNTIGETEFAGFAFPDNEPNVLEGAITRGKMDDIQYLLSIKAIGARYDCNDDSDEINEFIYRILYYALARWQDDTVLDDVLNVFGLTNETITRYLQYTKQMTFGFDVVKYDDIVTRAIWFRSLDRVKKIMGMIGETCFVDHVFKRDGSNRNGLDLCIDRGEGGSDTFKYLMSF